MKYLYIAILVVLVYMLIPNYPKEERHLFILSGQSNMDGLKQGFYFTPKVRAAFGYDNVSVVKDSQGGMPIRRWYKQWKVEQGDKQETVGDLYDRLMKKVNAETKGKSYTTVTFVWMQGERDVSEMKGEAYAASLRGLIDQIAKDMGCENINFVIGRISDFGMNNKLLQPHWTMVREAQVGVAEADLHGAWINTDDLNDGINTSGIQIKNNLHYSVEGFKLLGKRFAEKSIELIQSNTHQCT